MVSLLYIAGDAAVNAAAFSNGNLALSMLKDHGPEEERKRHDLAIKELQRVRDEWNEYLMKQLDFINKRLPGTQAAKTYINSADEVILEYYQAFAKKIKPLPPEPQLSDFYHLSEAKKKEKRKGELLFVAVGTVQIIISQESTLASSYTTPKENK